MMSSVFRKSILSVSAFVFTLMLIFPASAQKSGRCDVRTVIMFGRGKSSTVVRGQLEPCKSRTYKFRARKGQKMSLLLLPEVNDVVFWLQSTQFFADRGTYVLEGIHRNGVTEWKGELPLSGEYEIYIARPPVSNSTQERTLPYKLQMKIE